MPVRRWLLQWFPQDCWFPQLFIGTMPNENDWWAAWFDAGAQLWLCLLLSTDHKSHIWWQSMIPSKPSSQDNSLQCARNQRRGVWKSYLWPGVIIKLQCHSLFWCSALQYYPKCRRTILKGTLLIGSKRQIGFMGCLKGGLFFPSEVFQRRLSVISHILLNSGDGKNLPYCCFYCILDKTVVATTDGSNWISKYLIRTSEKMCVCDLASDRRFIIRFSNLCVGIIGFSKKKRARRFLFFAQVKLENTTESLEGAVRTWHSLPRVSASYLG